MTWCNLHNLSLNTGKAKKIIDFRKAQPAYYPPLIISGSAVERVQSIKFLWIHLREDLTSRDNTTAVTRKAQQRLHLLRRLKRTGLSKSALTVFYRGTIKSILTYCISSWYGNSKAEERQRLSRVIKTAERIIGVPQLPLLGIYNNRCTCRAKCIIQDSSHPSHRLFSLLQSGRRYRSIRTRTSRLHNSFFPSAVRLLNAQQ